MEDHETQHQPYVPPPQPRAVDACLQPQQSRVRGEPVRTRRPGSCQRARTLHGHRTQDDMS